MVASVFIAMDKSFVQRICQFYQFLVPICYRPGNNYNGLQIENPQCLCDDIFKQILFYLSLGSDVVDEINGLLIMILNLEL